MYIRNEIVEDVKNGDIIDEVGCLLIFDETYKSVIDSFSLIEGRNYICGSTKSVFEPLSEKSKKRVKNTKLKGNNKNENEEDYHAIIHVENGEFFVEDNNSEIGTFRKSLKFRIKSNCKYELIPGDDLYFGNLKTKLIRYDSMETIETPKWKRHSIENKEENDRIQLEIVEDSQKINQIENNQLKNKTIENESTSTLNEDTENDSLLLNKPKRKSPKNIQDKKVNDLLTKTNTDQVMLLWTGCTPTNKDIELIKRAKITYIDSEDLEFMSDKVTHVVSSSIKRTLKFLWAISKGIPIISPTTLRQILNSNKFKDFSFNEFNNLCMNQLLSDLEGEKKFGFSLKNSIIKAQNNIPIFNNYKFVISPNIKVPSISEISWLLKSNNAEIIQLEKAVKIQDKTNVIFIGTQLDSNKLFK